MSSLPAEAVAARGSRAPRRMAGRLAGSWSRHGLAMRKVRRLRVPKKIMCSSSN